MLIIVALGSITVVICYIINIQEIYESLTQIEGMWSIAIFILIRISFTLGMTLYAFRQWFKQRYLRFLDIDFLFGLFFLGLTIGKSLDLLYKLTYFTAEEENLLNLLKIRYILIILTIAPLVIIGIDIFLLIISNHYEQLTNNIYRNRINLITIALITAFESLLIIFAPDLIIISLILICVHMPSLAWITFTFYNGRKTEPFSELKPIIIAIAFFIDLILYTISIITSPSRNKNIGFSPTYIIFAELIDLIIIMFIFFGFYRKSNQNYLNQIYFNINTCQDGSFMIKKEIAEKLMKHTRKPMGPIGAIVGEYMSKVHERVAIWGLNKVNINPEHQILEIGCSAGYNINKLAKITTEGKIYGIDYSETMVNLAQEVNKHDIQMGRVEIKYGCVSSLSYPNNSFDLIMGIETVNFWPEIINDLKEIKRVLKPYGTLIIINNSYKHKKFEKRNLTWKQLTGFNLYTPKQFKKFFKKAGYVNIVIFEEKAKNWIAVIGIKKESGNFSPNL